MGEKKRADFYVDIMGHDINNLNQVILANLELLQESNRLEDAQNQYLEDAILATKDCTDTVNNVRALQEIAAGTCETLDVDLDRAIRESIIEISRPAGKQVSVRYTPLREPTRKSMYVKAMPELKLAIGNLVGNAIRYSGSDVHIDIIVSETAGEMTCPTAAGRKCLVMTIIDDGNGIPDKIKALFSGKPGQDAAVLHSKGLGLFTAKAMAEASGGWLKIEDRVPGDHTKGTRVTMALPAAEGD